MTAGPIDRQDQAWKTVEEWDRVYDSIDGVSADLSSAVSNSTAALINSNIALDAVAAEGIFNAKRYGAMGNGSDDDTSAIQAAINAAQASGGGVVYLPSGTYKTTSALATTVSNVQIKGDGAGLTVIKPTGTLSPFIAFTIDGPAQGAELGPITANFTRGTAVIALTSVAGIAAGDLLRINSIVTLDTFGCSATLIAEITSINSLQVTLEAPAPIDFLTTETPTCGKFNYVSHNGISDLTIDMAGATGVVTRAIRTQNTGEAIFENLEILNCTESGFQNWRGYRCVYNNIRLRWCGSGQESDFQTQDQSFCHYSSINSINAKGFGPQWIACAYSTVNGAVAFGEGGRGIKFHGCQQCTVNNLAIGTPLYTGLAISLRTQYCTFTNVSVSGCGPSGTSNDVGIWFSGHRNIGNRIIGCTLVGNNNWDIQFNDGDTDNLIIGAQFTDTNKVNNVGDSTNAVLYNAQNFTGLVTSNEGSAGELQSGFMKQSTTPAVGDFLGRYQWRGRSSADNERVYAEVSGVIISPTNAAEYGRLDLNLMENGAVVTHLQLQAPADGEVGLLIRRNVGGTLTTEQVSMGDPNSGGTGYKLLRVPN